jgi:hypothetical protein
VKLAPEYARKTVLLTNINKLLKKSDLSSSTGSQETAKLSI